MTTFEIRVRDAVESDAPAIAALLDALGHPLEPARVVAQLEALARQGRCATLVAEVDGRVVGLVSAQAMLMLHRPDPSGRVTVLVVDSAAHASGVGTRLLREAESFLAREGCTRIEVTSSPHRVEAHAFYLRRGYERQGERFAKVRR